jgi:allantoin racemase
MPRNRSGNAIMTVRIRYINPLGSASCVGIVEENLIAGARKNTILQVVHLAEGPLALDYMAERSAAEAGVLQAVAEAQRDGCEAVIVGSGYDPGVRLSRSRFDVPVIGAMEATIQMAGYSGASFAILASNARTAPALEEIAATAGGSARFRGIDAGAWRLEEMLADPAATGAEVAARCRAMLRRRDAEVAIVGCTVLAACLHRHLADGPRPEPVIINPNFHALKMAEGLAHLRLQDRYEICRSGAYAKPPVDGDIPLPEIEAERTKLAAE